MNGLTALLIFLRREYEHDEVFKGKEFSWSKDEESGTYNWPHAIADATVKVAPYVLTTYSQLIAFPPFFGARHVLYKYLEGHFLKHMVGWNFPDIPYKKENIDFIAEDSRHMLMLMGKAGLVGHTYDEQRELVFHYHNSTQGCMQAIEELTNSTKPTEITPHDPIFDLLRGIRHPAVVDAGRPFVLPPLSHERREFRIANALGPTDCHAFNKSTLNTPHTTESVSN